MGNIMADASAPEAMDWSARGQRVAVPLPLQPTCGVRVMS